MKVKSESEFAQLCLTLSYPMDCSLPGSSIHVIFQQEYWSGVPLSTLEGHLIQSCESWKAPWRKVIDVQVRLEGQGEVNLEQREQRVGRLRDTDGCQSSGSGSLLPAMARNLDLILVYWEAV